MVEEELSSCQEVAHEQHHVNQHQKFSWNAWAEMIQSHSYVFACYTGLSTQANSSEWFAIRPGNWNIVRHQIEAFGLEDLELDLFNSISKTSKTQIGQSQVGQSQVGQSQVGQSQVGQRKFESKSNTLKYNVMPHKTTIIRAFVLQSLHRVYATFAHMPQDLQTLLTDGPCAIDQLKELQSKDALVPNTFLGIVRTNMPIGAKAFLPMQETFKYNWLTQQLKSNAVGSEAYADAQTKLVELHTLFSTKCHALDHPLLQTTIRQNNASTTYSYVQSPMDYLCNECQTFGSHFSDACFLFADKKTAPKLHAFGPQKLEKRKAVDASDSMFYKLLHNKHQKT